MNYETFMEKYYWSSAKTRVVVFWAAVSVLSCGILIGLVSVLANGEVGPKTPSYEATELENTKLANESLQLNVLQEQQARLQTQMALVNAQQTIVSSQYQALVNEIKTAHKWGPEAKYDYKALKFNYDASAIEKAQPESHK